MSRIGDCLAMARLTPTLVLIVLDMTFLRASAADIQSTKQPDGQASIAIAGRIGKGDALKFQRMLDDARRSGGHAVQVSLSSPGGDVDESLGMARSISRAKSTTIVPEKAVCASSCFLIWAGGLVRKAGAGARLGVHSLSQEKTETFVAKARTVDIARTVSMFGAPSSVIGQMVVTDYKDMYWLTSGEIALMSRDVPPLVNLDPVPTPFPKRDR